MELFDYHQYCLNKKGVTSDFPFDEDTMAIRVAGKIFALLSVSAWESGDRKVNLKCDPERAEELRAEWDQVQPGYHMNKTHWNTVHLEGFPIPLFLELTDHSYDLIVQSLSKKQRDLLNDS